MSDRHVIDCHALWERVVRKPGGLPAVHVWLRLHGIDPRDVPLDSEMVIEDSAYGVVIRYEAYRRNAEGRIFVDPNDGERPAQEDRTALLRSAPPAEWLSGTGGEL